MHGKQCPLSCQNRTEREELKSSGSRKGNEQFESAKGVEKSEKIKEL